jgi:hypothetical protein
MALGWAGFFLFFILYRLNRNLVESQLELARRQCVMLERVNQVNIDLLAIVQRQRATLEILTEPR